MKPLYKLPLCVFFLIFFFSIHARGQSLAFGQVLVFNSTSDVLVPNGKVWKIENENNPSYQSAISNPQHYGCGYTDRIDVSFIVNGKPNYSERYINSGANLSVNTARNRFPVWLPEGTSLHVDCADHQLYIIEFSVIP